MAGVEARAVLVVVTSGVALSYAGLALEVARGFPCHAPNAVLDVAQAALFIGSAAALSGTWLLEALRARNDDAPPSNATSVFRLALLGLCAAASAGFVAAVRIGPC